MTIVWFFFSGTFIDSSAGTDQLRLRISSACTWRVAEKCMGNVNGSQNRGVNGEGIGGVRRTRGNKGVKARAENIQEREEKGRERGPLFVTVSGLSRSIISRKVLLTALIFCLFPTVSLLLLFPFRSVAVPFFFLFLIVNSARSFRRLSARRHA